MLELVDDKAFQAAFAHMMAMTYCGKHGTDGFIPRSALAFIHARKADADRLVKVGLWMVVPGGWAIHGWDEYQVSDEEAKRRREKAQKAAAARWDQK
ncbi:hypothetical protein R3Q06_27555 [Rhodococcus erythropolis]|uniref:hypothetical protein n=1 Tax=Rhodococcus erythropolis TaxID=1833 RepID=UPI002949A17C|nr:hypothetical protein [Rhodococcus erythropolis]MDV6277257.1 hypothetical protein [Rhodococcus erythropolis]